MFDDVGGKIKSLAIFTCCMGIIVSLIVGAVLITKEFFLGGILVIIIGSLMSWIGSVVLCGFGQLIENSNVLVSQSFKSEKQSSKITQEKSFVERKKNVNTATPSSVKPSVHQWRCDSCGSMINETICPVCGRNYEE